MKFSVEVSHEDAIKLERDLKWYGNCFITVMRTEAGAQLGKRLNPVDVKIDYSGKEAMRHREAQEKNMERLIISVLDNFDLDGASGFYETELEKAASAVIKVMQGKETITGEKS